MVIQVNSVGSDGYYMLWLVLVVCPWDLDPIYMEYNPVLRKNMENIPERQDPHLRYVYKKYSKAIIYSLLSVSLGLPSPDTLVRSAKLDEYLVTYRTK